MHAGGDGGRSRERRVHPTRRPIRSRSTKGVIQAAAVNAQGPWPDPILQLTHQIWCLRLARSSGTSWPAYWVSVCSWLCCGRPKRN